MPALLTIGELFQKLHEQLSLSWLTGKQGGERSLYAVQEKKHSMERASRVGYMNLSHPNRLQVVGVIEMDYLESLAADAHVEAVTRLFASEPAAVILADGGKVSDEMLVVAEQTGTPLFSTPQASNQLVNYLDHFLANLLADKEVLHGVFMEVMGIGVLLTGDSGIGKSELALELLSRGHRLIADDAPEFLKTDPDSVKGVCPPLLEGFLEVRGLGILNVASMFGDRSVKYSKYLRLVIHLQRMDDKEEYLKIDRLHGCRETQMILDVDIPKITLPVAPGRNLAVLVESAASNHILVMKGYDAARDFASRLKRSMTSVEGI